jgi:hypothetical protein
MNKITLLIYSTAACLSLLAGSAVAGNIGKNSKPTLVGAWQVEVTLRVDGPDCTIAPIVGGSAPNPFPSFNTFHEGGTMSEWGTRAPPATRGSGHGVWQRTGHGAFTYRDMFHSFDANGLLTATMDIRSDLKLAMDGNTFEGVSRFLRTDISGNALHFCATLSGARISL